MTESRLMWEVLVPTHSNDGEKFPLTHHQEWDAFVQSLVGGETILGVVRGRWIDPETGEQFRESMIPVHVACTEEQIDQINKQTCRHYGQRAVFAALISSDVRVYREVESNSNESI